MYDDGDMMVFRHSKHILCAFTAVLMAAPILLAQDGGTQERSRPEYRPNYESAAVGAPSSGLSERERSKLDRQYQFEVRGKSRLLITSSGTPAVEEGEESAPFIMDGKKYRRYLSAAIDLHKAGRLEESEKVLKFLSDSDPNDDYVKSYLSRVRRELDPNDKRWKEKAASEAASLKRERIKALLEEGVAFFNSQDFDSALVRFHDTLSIDPKNATAISYMKKLKAYYPQKREAEEIVTNWEAKREAPPAKASLDKAVEEMLDKNSAYARNVADRMIDQAQTEKTILNKKAEELLADMAFGSEVDAIISAKRTEEMRADQMLLGIGDILKVAVLNHPELSGEMVVQSNNMVSLPLTGDEIMATGLTVDELGEEAKKIVSKYVESPTVSVYLIMSKSQIFYIIDEVSSTPYPITRPDLTLRDALFLADWGDNRALGRVIVMKPSARNPIIKKVDAFNMIYRGDLRDNIRISNGDVIYVPMTAMAKITKGIYDTLAPFNAVRVARDMYLNMKWNEKDYKDFFRLPLTYERQSAVGKDDDNYALNVPNLYLRR